jgi:phosphatidylglycerophosphate synthase
MANAVSRLDKNVTPKHWTLEEIREVGFQGQEDLVTYRLAKRIAPHTTWVFLRWNFAPNTLTFVFIGLLVLASLVLALRPRDGAQIVALLIVASYIIDCSDGPVARATGRTSTVGNNLDLLGHWVTSNLLILGATLGEIGTGGSNSAWLAGMLALVGTTSFHYMQLLLVRSSPSTESAKGQPENDISTIKRIRRIFHLFEPLDTNLILFTSLAGLPFLGIQIWAVVSIVATLAIFGQYYWRETR